MALKYNGTSPTAIKYNGTDLTVLKYGTTAVWGKPYSLSISAGANTTVTVTRTSSPNQHASTGTLSSGSVIYYGDVITVSYSVSSGYKISTATVNGTAFTSGQSFTVTSVISVVTTAVASASWKTVWTGSLKVQPMQTIKTFTVSGLVSSAQKTRVTFEGYISTYYENWDTYESTSTTSTAKITAQELNCGFYGDASGVRGTFGGQSASYTPSSYPFYICLTKFADGKIHWTYKSSSQSEYGDNYYKEVSLVNNFVVTKVEQYY